LVNFSIVLDQVCPNNRRVVALNGLLLAVQNILELAIILASMDDSTGELVSLNDLLVAFSVPEAHQVKITHHLFSVMEYGA
jgi:hypothetical protein